MNYIEHMKTRDIQRAIGLLIICIMMGVQSPALQGQSLSGTDLTTVNVDDLSDQQLIGYLEQAKASGYTQTQLEAFARQRGMPESQISKLRARLSQLKLETGQGLNAVTNAWGSRGNLGLTEESVFGRLATENGVEKLTEEQRKIFGFALFRSGKLNFSPNLNIPTPVDYVLGPGDGIVIDLWGATQQYWTLEISAEGIVRLQDLGPVYVNGLTIEEAKEKLVNRLSQAYDGLKPSDGGKPTIFNQISLGNIRSINVTIVGEVHSPGNYALNSLSTVFTALHAAGGPTENGTFRSVRLMRNNKLKAEIDIYDFLVEGIKPNDELLRDGDVVLVKQYGGHVKLEGEVRRPGVYEIKEGDTFQDLLKNAGGFASNAFRSFIDIQRNAANGKTILNISGDEFDKKFPADGDVIFVRLNQETYNNRVQLEGAVQMAGIYELTDNMSVKDLIEKANGLKGDAYLNRGTIYRMSSDFSQEAIAFDLQKLLSGQIADIALVNEDIVKISSIYELRDEYYVEINGEIAIPGTYPFINNMTVEDIIMLAGGLIEGASGANVEISRRNTEGLSNSLAEIVTFNIDKNLSVSSDARNVRIEPFDQVFIRRTPNYNIQQQITLEGEITSPGIYVMSRKDERVSDVINRAGGLTSYAYPEGAILIRKTEFAEKKNSVELNLEKLEGLKSKILNDTTMSLNQAREMLIDRLSGLITETADRYIDSGSQEIGNRIKKRLTENIGEGDSLIIPVALNEEEPTVLDLTEILKNPGSKYDFILREGDVISIPGKLETVRVAGEVTSPLNLRYDNSFSFKDYINDAGGFTSNAKKGRSYVQYPDGRRKQARRFLFFKFFPKIQPGSTIFVSRKPERAGVNIQSIIAATGSVATLALVIDRLSN